MEIGLRFSDKVFSANMVDVLGRHLENILLKNKNVKSDNPIYTLARLRAEA